MIRDAKMMQLVANDKEPITPFVHFVQSLHRECQISTIMVVGGLGDYFDVADHVLMMDSYRCEDATLRAKEIVSASNSHTIPSEPFGSIRTRFPVKQVYNPDGKVKTIKRGLISYGDTELDLSSVEQVVSSCQTTAIGAYLQRIAGSPTRQQEDRTALVDVIASIDAAVDKQGLDALAPGQFHGGFTRPRHFEVGAACNRLRRPGAMKQS